MSTSETERTLAEAKRLFLRAEKTEFWLPSFRVHDVVAAARTLVDDPTKTNLGKLSETLVAYRSNAGVRKDLFGFCDVLALTQEGFLAIQSTSKPNVGGRLLKIRTQCQEEAHDWITAGGQIEVWGWFKAKKAVDRKFWQCVRRAVTLADVTRKVPF